MKSVIKAICLFIPLVILFVVIDRKDFYSGDDVAVQQESVSRKPITVTTLNPVEKTTESKSAEVKPLETKPVAEMMPVETKAVIETNPAESKPVESKSEETKRVSEMMPVETKVVIETNPAETKPVESKPVKSKCVEGKLAPAAIPTVTTEEAEKLNAEAMLYAEKHERKMEFFRKGLKLVYDDRMKSYTTISIPERYEEVLIKNGVVKSRADFSTRKAPYLWTIDYSTLKGNCDFSRNEDGFGILSPDGVLKIYSPVRSVYNTTMAFSVELSCNSAETTVKAGIEELGLSRPGKTYIGVFSGINKNECINFEISALEHYDMARLFLEVSGDVTIHGMRIYQKEIEGITYLEGTIIERSALPDPEKSDYPNCRFTAQFEGNVIKGGERCPGETALVIDGFKDYKTLKTNSLKKGDKILCAIIPYETLSDEEQSIQQADDLNLFALDNYYVLWVRKLNTFAEGDNPVFPASGVHFLDEKKQAHISIYDRHINPPVSKELQESQRQAISREIDEIDKMLKGYDEDKISEINTAFAKTWKSEKEKDTSGYNTCVVRDGKVVWRRFDNSFFNLNVAYSTLIEDRIVSDDTIAAFVELKKALEANGVQLIVSVIPRRDQITARIINEGFRNTPDYCTYYNVRKLLEHGIETIAPSKEIVDRFNEEEFAYNIGLDNHPSILVQKIVSEMLAQRLERYRIPKRLKKDLFYFEEEKHDFYGSDPLNVYPDNCDIGKHKPGEEIKVRKPKLPEDHSYTNNNSEVLVVGNSFTVSPYTSGFGLVSWLDYYLETDVTYYQYTANGPATVFINNLLQDPEKYLKNKKIAIIQFALDHLLNVQWHNIGLLDRQMQLLSSASPMSTITIRRKENTIISNLKKEQASIVNRLDGMAFQTSIDEFEITKTSIDTFNKKTLIVIPACLISGNVSIAVNGESQVIPSSFDETTTSYQTLIFEIPTDTKDIVVSIKGHENSVCVIKDIQIWQ